MFSYSWYYSFDIESDIRNTFPSVNLQVYPNSFKFSEKYFYRAEGQEEMD